MAKDGKGHGSDGKGGGLARMRARNDALNAAKAPKPSGLERMRARNATLNTDKGKGADSGMKAARKPTGYAKMQEPPKGCKTK